MVSVERIKQFTNIPSEAEWNRKDFLPPPEWPNRGNAGVLRAKDDPWSPKGYTHNARKSFKNPIFEHYLGN